jgi:hypothetical protein
MQIKSVVLVFAAIFVACAAAQSNSSTGTNVTTPTIPVSVYSPSLTAELVTCPLRDQILRLNQLAAVEYVNRAFFIDLMTHFNSLPSTASTSALGLPAGFTLSDVQSNLTLIVNQLNIVASFFNSTIPSWCPLLTADDQSNCYVYAPCSNYSFGNFSSWSTAAASNSSVSNSTVSSNTTHTNGTGSSNTTHSNSTSSSLPSSSTVMVAVRQGVYFSNQLVNYIIGSVPLFSNSTLQLQLMEFEAMHAQQASYLDLLSNSTPLLTPTIVTNANSNNFNRGAIMSGFVGFIPNPTCCDGWRNVKAA